MNRTFLNVAAGMLLAFAGAAMAQDGKVLRTAPEFADIDTDGDGVISEQEFEAFKARRGDGSKRILHMAPSHGGVHLGPPAFEDVDADGDEMVTREELQAFMEQKRADGKMLLLSADGQATLFDEADTDRDGVLNRDEFEQMMQGNVHRKKRVLMRSTDLFGRADVDGDGMISREEFDDVMGQLPPHAVPESRFEMFTEADTDGDGKLSQDEFVAMMEGIGKVTMRFARPAE